MDVATSAPGTDALITISDYLQLPPPERPTHLWCAGNANGQPCNGAVFAKAAGNGPIAAHFASLEHADACDHAANRCGHPALRDQAQSDPSATLILTPAPAAAGRSALPRGPRRATTPEGNHASLRTVLRALTTTGLPDDLLVQWRDQPPMLAYEFFIHLDSATRERDELRGYWGRIATVRHSDQTGSTRLVPRSGVAIIIDAPTSLALGLRDSPAQLSPLTNGDALAVAPLRRAKSGRLYVLVNDTTRFTSV